MPTYKEIIEATDIVSLVSKYVNLKKQGANYVGLCPFHHDTNPSFFVNPEKKICKCFSCGEGGDALSFLEKIENISYKEAINKLASFNGIVLDNVVEKVNPNDKYYDALQNAIDYFHKNLLYTDNGDKALDYLLKRGIDKDIIKIFSIGLSPDIGSTLHDALLKIDIAESTMEEVGLTSLKNGKYYDYFTKRIMFPIYDDNNKPVGFSARIFNGETNEPKYINTKDTKIYQKNSIWFNLNKAIPEIRKKNRAIIHEGQMDVIASYRAGLKEAICSMGTALNPNQVNLLKKYTNNVILCYDSDNAGMNAAKKSQEIFKMAGFNVHLVFLDGVKDPDEFVLKKGTDAYLDYFENNIVSYLEYVFHTVFLNKNLEDTIVLKAIEEEIFSELRKESSFVIKEDYLKKLASLLKTSYEAVSSDFNSYLNTHVGIFNKEPSAEKEDIKEPELIKNDPWYSLAELRLIIYARERKEDAKYINDKLSTALNGVCINTQNLLIKIIDGYYAYNDEFEEQRFIKYLDEDNLAYYIKISKFLKNDKAIYNKNDLEKCINKVIDISYTNKLESIKRRMKNAPEEKKDELYTKMFKLRQEHELFKRRIKNAKAK